MGLLFAGSNSDKVTVTAASSINNWDVGALIYWAYRTAAGSGNGQRLEQKGVGAARRMLALTSIGELTLEVGRATTTLDSKALLTNFSAEGINKWCCYACSWDVNGAAGDQILAVGDLASPLAEPSSYASQQVGSGATGDNSGNNQIIGNHPTLNESWPGRIAIALRINAKLTLSDLRSLQFRPFVRDANVKGFYHFGFNGTGTQYDWSGNLNNGTVTGATQVSHVPLGPPFGF